MTDLIRDYDFHPPDDVRVFPMPRAGVRRLDDDAFVADARYGEIIMRHYALREHWFKVNCTMDANGGLVETTSPDDVPPFTFNCDIATPMLRRGDAVLAVDLWLDVLVRCDGVTHGVRSYRASRRVSSFPGCLRRWRRPSAASPGRRGPARRRG